MVKIGLQLKAALSNVTRLYPEDLENFNWILKVKCTGCGEENPNWHSISAAETVELPNGEANFLCKCKFCSRENSISIIESNDPKSKEQHRKLVTTVYEESDDGNFKTVISFDCRGLDLIDYQFGDGWLVQSDTKKFKHVDLSEKEWCEYNDVNNEPVEINELQFKFISLK